MSVFLDIVHLLTVPPGGMVYYLVLLFSIWAIVGLAFSRWARGERRGTVPRLLIAGGLMSFARLVPFVIALLDRQDSTDLLRFTPPLERFVDTLSVLLLCWAFVLPPEQRALSNAFIGGTSLFALGFYVIAAIGWAGTFQADEFARYNLSWQRWVWELGQLAVLICALVYLLFLSAKRHGILIVVLGTLAAGHLLQSVLPRPDQISHYAGWVRLANLAAFPMLAVSTFQIIVQRFSAHSMHLESINQESLSQITGLMDLLDISRKLSSSLDADTTIETAAQSVSQALQADLCAFALSIPNSDSEMMELSIVYNAPDITQPGLRFRPEEYPAIDYAVTRGKPVVLGPEESGQAAEIHRLLGNEQAGPLIIQPLAHASTVTGVMLICRPGQPTPFAPMQARKCEAMSSPISLALGNALAYRQTRGHVEQQVADLRVLEMESVRARAHLENQLKQSQAEVAFYVQRLYETETNEQRAQEDANQLRQELNTLKRQPQIVDSDGQGLKKSMDRISALAQQVAKLDAMRLSLGRRIQVLEQEKGDLASRLEQSQASTSTLKGRAQDLEFLLSGKLQTLLRDSDLPLLNAIASGVILCDPVGRIVHINTVAAHMLGIEGDESVGGEARSLWPGEDWHTAVRSATDQYRDGVSPPETLFLKHERQELQVEITPLLVDDRHVGATITLQDVKAAAERTRARDEFLASLAQELRTPMTSILGYTDLLMSDSVGQLEGIQRKFLQRVQANIERMVGMLNDLIGVTAIDTGKLVIELEPVDVVRVIESALRKAQFRLEEKELAARLEIGDLPVIYADPDHVQQIIDNLLTNACKSSLVESSITVRAYVERNDQDSSSLHVAVSDTGGGIAPEDRARAFERFYRADTALIAGLGETGVGLAIVKALVEAHQGRVWIESEMGEGTTFHFTLPFGLRQMPGGGGLRVRAAAPQPAAGEGGHG